MLNEPLQDVMLKFVGYANKIQTAFKLRGKNFGMHYK